MTESHIESNVDLYNNEYRSMLEHALKSGIELPNSIVVSTDNTIISIESYNNLVRAIAPATPKSIKFINQEIIITDGKHRWYNLILFKKCLLISLLD